MSSRIVKYCAEECQRQQSGELSVWWMYQAWELLCGADPPKAENENMCAKVLHLAATVEPKVNAKGIRTVRVVINKGDYHDEVMPHTLAENALRVHCSDERIQEGMENPTEWYRIFEEIHPFMDGNGRVGSLMWNWLRGSLGRPFAPPDLWEKGD